MYWSPDTLRKKKECLLGLHFDIGITQLNYFDRDVANRYCAYNTLAARMSKCHQRCSTAVVTRVGGSGNPNNILLDVIPVVCG